MTDEEIAEGANKSRLVGGGIAAVLVAGAVGLIKNADNLIRPALRHADDAGRAIGRHVDDAGRAIGPNADAAGRVLLRQADDGAESSDSAILRSVLKEGAQNTIQNADKFAEFALDDGTGNTAIQSEMRWGVTISVRESTDSYEIEEDGYYHLSQTHSVSETRVTVDGTEMPIEKETDTELPDRAIGEYDRRQLKRRLDGDTYMLEEYRFAVGDGEFVALKTEPQIEFVTGDWTRYAAGDDVTVRYTAAGLKESATSIEKQLRQEFTTAIQALLRRRYGDSVSTQLESNFVIKRMSNETMVINKTAIHSTAEGPFEIAGEIGVTIGQR
jgi:hypothetical protein